MRDLQDYKVLNFQVGVINGFARASEGFASWLQSTYSSIALGTDTPRKLYDDDPSAAYCALLAETWNPVRRGVVTQVSAIRFQRFGDK